MLHITSRNASTGPGRALITCHHLHWPHRIHAPLFLAPITLIASLLPSCPRNHTAASKWLLVSIISQIMTLLFWILQIQRNKFPIGIKSNFYLIELPSSTYLLPHPPPTPFCPSYSLFPLLIWGVSAKTPYLGVFTLVPSASNTHLPESSMASSLLQASVCSYFIEESSQVPTIAPLPLLVPIIIYGCFPLTCNVFSAPWE